MQIDKLHYITTNFSDAEQACRGGAGWIQLRIKNKAYEEWKAIARETKKVCEQYGTKLIINDSVQLAKEIGAAGVHLGKEDMSPAEARIILGDQFIIGGTANTWEDIKRLTTLRIDYIGLGPFRYTQTKTNLSPLLGIKGYDALMKNCRVESVTTPMIAIGGIQKEDIHSVLATGVFGIAVSSAITNSGNIKKETFRFKEAIENYKRE